MPSLLEEIMRRRRPELAGILGGDTPPSSTARVAGLLGEAPPSGPGGLLDSRPAIPNPQRVSAPGGQLPSLQQQQQAQFRAQTEQMRRQGEQQLRARQARQQGVGRNREPKPGEKGLSFFAKLFTGSRIDGLKRQEQENLLQPALIRAGLTMLAAPVGTPWPQALAAGILAGRQEATQTAGALLDEKQAQQRAIQYRRIFENTDLSEIEQWREARKIAAKKGDMDSVKAFNDVLEGLEGAGANQENWKYDEINGMPVWVDAENREIRDLEGNLVHEAPEPPKDDQQRIQRINQIGDDYRQEAQPLLQSDRLARTALSAPEQDPAAQQTMIMALNRLLSPNSTVRQSEFARVAEMGGLEAQAQQYWNRFAEKGQLGPEVEDSIRAEIERLHRANQQEIQSLNQFYQRRALDAGVDPRLVIRSIQQGGIGRDGNGNSQNGSGRVSTGAGTSGAPTLFPEDDEEGGI